MLIIFDLDGTLLNTSEDLTAAANEALCVCGFAPRSTQECRQFAGNGVAKLLERALPEEARTPENLVRVQQAFFSYYDKHLWDHTYPYAGIEDLLFILQKQGIQLAVASNKYQSATQRLMAHFFPQITFAAVLGQRDKVPTKPHPQIVQEILSLANENKENCLYVGDSEVDMQTAQNARVKACGVTWGFRPRDTLTAYQPRYLIQTPEELLSLVQ